MNHLYKPYGIDIDWYALNKTSLLVDAITNAILQGTLRPGDRLLSHRKLSDALKLGINIIRSAYENLVKQEYLKTVGRGRTIVAWNLKYLDPALAKNFTLGSNLREKPMKTIGSFLGAQMEYLQIGRDGLNPAIFLQDKSNPTTSIIKEELQKTLGEWMQYSQEELEFMMALRRKLAQDFYVGFDLNQIALSENRLSVFVDLFENIFEKGQIVILCSNADRKLKRLLNSCGLRLFFIEPSETGMCLTELKRIIDHQNSIEDPVTCIYSRPYQDSFSNLRDIDARREAIYTETQAWGVMLIEEYAQNEYVIHAKRGPWAEKAGVVHYKDVIMIGTASSLFAGMEETHFIIGSKKTIADFKRKAIAPMNKTRYSLPIYKRVLEEGVITKHKHEILHQLESWQTKVQAAAQKYLSGWFDLKEGAFGSSFWMVVKNKGTIHLPFRLMEQVSIEYSHSAYEDGEFVSVQALRICLGFGDIKSIDKVFKIMNEYLTKSRPVFNCPNKRHLE